MTQLDPDVQAMIAAAKAAGSTPMHQLGVDKARALMTGAPRSPAPAMASTTDDAFRGPYGQVAVRIYRPNETDDQLPPAIIYFHGGGMIGGTIDSFDSLARHLAAASDAVVISVGYHLAPEFPYPVATDEAYEAIRWVFTNSTALAIDPQRMAVAGDSAGGSLAAGAALRARDEQGPKILVQALFYPGLERAVKRPSMIEFSDGPLLTAADVGWMKDQYLGPDPTTDTVYGVPSLATDLTDLPDAIVVTASNDPIRDAAEDYALRMQAAGTATILMRYPGVCHGFLSQAGWIQRASTAFAEIGALLRTKLANPRS